MTSKTASDAVIAKGGASVAKRSSKKGLSAGRSAKAGAVMMAALRCPAKTATVNTRIDADLKADAEAVLRKLSLTPTDAVRLLYKQIALRRGLPFDLAIPNAETVAALEEAERGGGKAYRGSSREIIKAMLHDAE